MPKDSTKFNCHADIVHGTLRGMSKVPALEMKNVTVELGGEVILKEVSLSIPHGETLVIIGPSGGGKTVLIKTLAGIYPPSIGKVLCDGEDWQKLESPEKHKLSEKIGVQFQKSALFDSLSVFENVAFPIREHHPEYDEQRIKDRVEECLLAVNLLESAKMFPHDLSGGMKQRLSIARAISLNPEIVFYDDPTAGLDPINSDRMADLIINLKKKFNTTLIIVTHDMKRAYQLAGRIVLVANGQVIETGSAEATANSSDERVQQFIHGKLKGPLIWG